MESHVLIIKDSEEIRRAVKATDTLMVLWDFDQYLRDEYKYNGNEAAYEMREKLSLLMDDHGVNLDDLLS